MTDTFDLVKQDWEIKKSKKMSETMKKKWATKEFREKQIIGHKNANREIFQTPEYRKTLSERISGSKHPNFGKHLSEVTRKKISDAHRGKKGHPCSDETKYRLSLKFKGRKMSEEQKLKISKANKGRLCSQEQKDIISKNMKELWKDEEYRKHMSNTHKGQIPPRKTKEQIDAWTKQMTQRKLGVPLTTEHKKHISEGNKNSKKRKLYDYTKFITLWNENKSPSEIKEEMSLPSLKTVTYLRYELNLPKRTLGLPPSSKDGGREYKRAYMKFRCDNLRASLLKILCGDEVKCQICGYADERALCLDHINNDGKNDRWNIGKKKRLNWLRHYNKHIDEAKQKLQVLCYNCNRIKEVEYIKNGGRKI